MNPRSVLSALSCAILLAALSGCAEEAAMQQPKGTPTAPRPTGANAPSRPSPSTGTSSTPSGTTSKPATSTTIPQSLDPFADTINACLSRIPKDSTSGERMMAEGSCRRDEALRTGAVSKGGNLASAGSQDDSMQACMARIPKDATAGQKMLAEESCKRDEANRK